MDCKNSKYTSLDEIYNVQKDWFDTNIHKSLKVYTYNPASNQSFLLKCATKNGYIYFVVLSDNINSWNFMEKNDVVTLIDFCASAYLIFDNNVICTEIKIDDSCDNMINLTDFFVHTYGCPIITEITILDDHLLSIINIPIILDIDDSFKPVTNFSTFDKSKIIYAFNNKENQIFACKLISNDEYIITYYKNTIMRFSGTVLSPNISHSTISFDFIFPHTYDSKSFECNITLMEK